MRIFDNDGGVRLVLKSLMLTSVVLFAASVVFTLLLQSKVEVSSGFDLFPPSGGMLFGVAMLKICLFSYYLERVVKQGVWEYGAFESTPFYVVTGVTLMPILLGSLTACYVFLVGDSERFSGGEVLVFTAMMLVGSFGVMMLFTEVLGTLWCGVSIGEKGSLKGVYLLLSGVFIAFLMLGAGVFNLTIELAYYGYAEQGEWLLNGTVVVGLQLVIALVLARGARLNKGEAMA